MTGTAGAGVQRLEAGQEVRAVDLGHHHVEQHERRAGARRCEQRGGRVGEGDGDVAGLLDHAQERLARALVVVDDHDLPVMGLY